MCNDNSTAAFTDGLVRARSERRTFLKLGAAGLLFSSVAAVPERTAAAVPDNASRASSRFDLTKRAYVVVLDGTKPGEIDGPLMPNLAALRDAGYRFPRAGSLPVMETIPNHVMMMSGVRPDRSGVPANSVFDGTTVRTLDRPSDLVATTILEQLDAAGATTGTVLSKNYLYGIFGTRATHRWEPTPTDPLTGHALDVFTMDAALTMIDEFDPNLVFINLGSNDRFGHADVTGTSVQAARQAALADSDLQVSRLVSKIKEVPGRWESSILIVLADHSMDWSVPTNVISLEDKLTADPLLTGRIEIAQNGGADLVYFTGAEADRDEAVKRIIAISSAQDGVLAAHDRANSPDLRLGANAGDVLVYCRAGWRFSDPAIYSNPIPGNHGHPATTPIPFFISGGHPVVPTATASSAYATTADVAPTLGTYFGIKAPTKAGWDGTSRL
ncbi:alkaline phosphatase family protein [Nocardioides sp. NPDC057767]|uniref:alkaline phosphatase family protein n=1 Tax=unclassified Nocardioides TaxID=2615069 RepID=UPI0036705905